ncbi:perilipin-1 isoform X2 [Brachyhypopomus gauderio]|uniref:perilipin-1 isoform X2 n=1 Tax=Brachyhypopomus gauderio TaxID=698409 RepID=UPI0040418B07
MALEKRNPNLLENSQSVFVRLWNLPSVIITVEVVGRTYTSAKSSNMLLSSVCEVCERGLSSAGCVAACSVWPVLLVLQPQLIAANLLACKGLDLIEKKMLTLEFPPAKAAEMAALMSSVIQNPAVQYILYSKLSCLAEEGTDTVLTFTENLVNYILPASSDEIEEEEVCQVQEASVVVAVPKPGLVRLGVLAATICRRAYGQTAIQLQRTKSRGHQLVKSIPSMSSLMDLAKNSTAELLEALTMARQRVLDSLSSALLSGRSSKPREKILYCDGEDQKAEDTKNPSDCSPPLKPQGRNWRASQTWSAAGEGLMENSHTEAQPSEQVHPLHTEQILEEKHPVPPLES